MRGTPARLLDVLETDGGWLTIAGLAMRVDAQERSVDRALWRLHAKGCVDYRVVEMATGHAGPRAPSKWSLHQPHTAWVERRSEWRFVHE